MKKTKIPEKQGAKKHTYTYTKDDLEVSAVIQEPTFDQLCLSFTELMRMTGEMNIIGAGKRIYDLCCIERDDGIEESRILMRLCTELATDFVIPADGEIKKN